MTTETQNIVAIELCDSSMASRSQSYDGCWVHIVTQDDTGYHRVPHEKYNTSQGAQRVAKKLANQYGVKIVHQSRLSESIHEVMTGESPRRDW